MEQHVIVCMMYMTSKEHIRIISLNHEVQKVLYLIDPVKTSQIFQLQFQIKFKFINERPVFDSGMSMKWSTDQALTWALEPFFIFKSLL